MRYTLHQASVTYDNVSPMVDESITKLCVVTGFAQGKSDGRRQTLTQGTCCRLDAAAMPEFGMTRRV